MRKVVTNSEVPHLWAHKAQPEARNSTGSLFFDGPTIYSYGTHFPIATHVTNCRGEVAVLFTTRDYSVTTSGHKSSVTRSIPRGMRVFHVDLSGLDRWSGFKPAGQVASYNERIKTYERKAVRVRSESSRNYELSQAASLHAEALAFVAFYDLSESVVELTTDLETLKTAVREESKRKAATERERKLKLQAEYAEQIKRWLAGESVYFPQGLDTILRVKDGEVETSRGARFPVEHAKRGLLLVESVRQSGEPWVTNGHTCYLGPYKIDRIDSNGTVHAGCHVVKYSAIETIKAEVMAWGNDQTIPTKRG